MNKCGLSVRMVEGEGGLFLCLVGLGVHRGRSVWLKLSFDKSKKKNNPLHIPFFTFFCLAPLLTNQPHIILSAITEYYYEYDVTSRSSHTECLCLFGWMVHTGLLSHSSQYYLSHLRQARGDIRIELVVLCRRMYWCRSCSIGDGFSWAEKQVYFITLTDLYVDWRLAAMWIATGWN